MSPAKKTSTGKSKSQVASSRWFSGATSMVVLCLALFGIFISFVFAAWRQIGPRVLSSQEYYIGPGQIEFTPLPDWIHRMDISAEIFNNLSRQKTLSIMDDDLIERVAVAFSAHPWVYKVRRVEKSYPAKIRVDLVYRRPVCMVEIPGGLMPIDAEAVLLPKENFSPVEAAKYPRLVGIDRGPMGLVGSRWGDSRVVGGAEIATTLLPFWEKFNLQFILPIPPPENSRSGNAPKTASPHPGEFSFAVITRGGMKIIWGRSPHVNISGELTPRQKTAKLEQFFAEHGSLDYPQGPRELDLNR